MKPCIRIVAMLFLVVAICSATQINYDIKLINKKSATVSLEKYKGKPLYVIYYSLKCAKCKKAVDAIVKMTRNKGCYSVVGIVTSSEPEKEYLADKTVFPFEIYYDKWKHFKNAYSIETVPMLLAADSGGRIVINRQGYYEGNFEDMLVALQTRLCEKEYSMPAFSERYYGAHVCAVCHSSINSWWEKSKHGVVYDQVAKKYFGRSGFRKNAAGRVPPDVLARTTTGFGKHGGYDVVEHQKHLLGVQCEACHTMAGPHDKKPQNDMQGTCVACHSSAHDPTFEYRTYLWKLKHPKNREK